MANIFAKICICIYWIVLLLFNAFKCEQEGLDKKTAAFMIALLITNFFVVMFAISAVFE